jgi:hypothetical protein
MQSYRFGFWGLLALLAGVGFTTPAWAQQTLRCESEHYSFQRCPVPPGSEVRSMRQLSEADCRRGDTWGE